MDAAEDDAAELELRAVLERVVLVRGLGGGVDADRDPVLDAEPAVAGEMVGMRVGLDDPDDPHAAPVGLGEVLLDRECGVDDRRHAPVLVADQI